MILDLHRYCVTTSTISFEIWVNGDIEKCREEVRSVLKDTIDIVDIYEMKEEEE